MECSCCIIMFLSFLIAGLVQGGKINETGYLELPNSGEMLSKEDLCSPWFFYNTVTKHCECYHSPSSDSIVSCTEQGALLKYGFCMTHEKGWGTFVSQCQYFEVKGHNVSENPGFITLPDNVSELNEYMCGPMNRNGLVCSKCVENFGPSFTFFGYSCSDCTNAWYSIPLYLVLEFVPITLFYLIVLFF